jgi:hypothetical protein
VLRFTRAGAHALVNVTIDVVPGDLCHGHDALSEMFLETCLTLRASITRKRWRDLRSVRFHGVIGLRFQHVEEARSEKHFFGGVMGDPKDAPMRAPGGPLVALRCKHAESLSGPREGPAEGRICSVILINTPLVSFTSAEWCSWLSRVSPGNPS